MRERFDKRLEPRHVFADNHGYCFKTEVQANLIDGEQIDLVCVDCANVGPREARLVLQNRTRIAKTITLNVEPSFRMTRVPG